MIVICLACKHEWEDDSLDDCPKCWASGVLRKEVPVEPVKEEPLLEESPLTGLAPRTKRVPRKL